ncbi:MAG: 6-hydroxymethylpterin diphosphokinase MptE-like protein [Candidatus Hadarchaeia archaeon]
MDWTIWKKKYDQIQDRLNIDMAKDQLSAQILKNILVDFSLDHLRKMVRGKNCMVFGAGPSLDADLEKLRKNSGLEEVLISADGATSAVKKFKTPHIIVTDLDGKIEDQLESWENGSWLVVHAHGDNIERIKEVVPRLDERVVGTTQIGEQINLPNFGGFTDGDRAAFMAHELGASKIYLAGMDLGKKIGVYSGKTNPEKKMIKLEICRDLLSWLSKDLGAPLYNITSGGEDIPHIPKVKYQKNDR